MILGNVSPTIKCFVGVNTRYFAAGTVFDGVASPKGQLLSSRVLRLRPQAGV